MGIAELPKATRMNTKLKTLLFLAVIACSTKGVEANLPIVMGILSPIADFSDLDTRDVHNNPISDASVKDQLNRLFIENAFRLWAVDSPRLQQDVSQSIEYFLHLFNKSFLTFKAIVLGLWMPALKPLSKLFVHSVDKLWIISPATHGCGLQSLCFFVLRRPLQTIILRC